MQERWWCEPCHSRQRSGPTQHTPARTAACGPTTASPAPAPPPTNKPAPAQPACPAHLLELDDEAPVVLAQLIPEHLLQHVNGLAPAHEAGVTRQGMHRQGRWSAGLSWRPAGLQAAQHPQATAFPHVAFQVQDCPAPTSRCCPACCCGSRDARHELVAVVKVALVRAGGLLWLGGLHTDMAAVVSWSTG